ncbi:MAG: ABC transporter substrate-binding protein [Myxococcota bacterium]|nr:ABC transporter substrate-binding protein [Myxococcota bacterium]
MLLLLTMGCSLTRYDFQECTEPVECRAAFGFGHTCGEEGYCAVVEPPERCKTTVPSDLFARPGDYSEVVLLGSLYDHESDQAELAAVQLPFMQVNESGGLDADRPFGLISCDYQESDDYGDGMTSDEAAVAMAEWMISELGVRVILGPASSSKVEAVYKATQDDKPLIISSNATSPALTDLDGTDKSDESPGTVWRTAPSDVFQGRIIGLDLNGRGLSKVGVIYADDSYGASLKEVTLATYTGAAVELPFTTTTGLTEAVVDALADPEIEELLFLSSDISEIIVFLEAMAFADNLGDREIFLADGASDQQLFSQAKPEVKAILDRVRGTRPQVPSGAVFESFKSAYNSTFESNVDDSVFTAYAYDAAWLGIYGTTWALANGDESTGAAAAAGLRQLSSGDAVEIRPSTWETAKVNLSTGQSFDVVGASGALDFDPDTEEADSNIEVWAINPAGTDFIICQTFGWTDTGNPKPLGTPNPACTADTEVTE